MDLMTRRRALLARVESGGGGLPAEYQSVQYIESTGTQCIDTGFIANYATGITLVKGASNAGLYNFLFGAGSDSNQYGINGNYFNFFARTNNHVDGQNDNGTIEISGGVLSINGVTKIDLSNITSGTTPNTLKLFCRSATNGTLERYTAMKLYSCKLFDGQTLVRDYIPCYRKSDNKPGLYDLANNQFYTNAGTGEFLLP